MAATKPYLASKGKGEATQNAAFPARAGDNINHEGVGCVMLMPCVDE